MTAAWHNGSTVSTTNL